MTTFEIRNYDKGGMNAIAGDGKLTGKEVKLAQKDGWTVWDGYSVNDGVPTNTNTQENEVAKEYINFDEFDIGGKNAIAGDGVLNGAEAERAREAGYDSIWDGRTKEDLEKYPDMGLRKEGYAFGGITRTAANNTDNKFVRGMALVADLVLMPVTFPISFIQAFNRED